jgi:DNA polymerase III alpha subunit
MIHGKKIHPLGFISSFSFLKGSVPPFEMAKALKGSGYEFLPATEIATTAGLATSVRAAREFDLNLIYGQKINSENFYFTLYPGDEKAFFWISYLCSQLHFSDKDCQNQQNEIPAERVIAMAPPAGRGKVIFSGQEPENLIDAFKISGWDCFLSMPTSFSRQTKDWAVSLAKKFSLGLIYSPCISFRDNYDRKALRLLNAIGTNSLLHDTRIPDGYDLEQLYGNLCLDCDQALKNNQSFVKTGFWIPEQNRLLMPSFCPSDDDSARILFETTLQGLKRKYRVVSDKVTARFNYEFGIIRKMGFCDYFLTVNEIKLEAKKLGTRVLGRGSAANSLVSYALDLTQVDPIEHNLYFERFLNPHRQSPPDIDLDFSWRIRDQIYQFLKKRWKQANVGLVSAHIRLTSKKAIRETGKTLGLKTQDLNFLTSIVGRTNLKDFLHSPDTRSRFQGYSDRLQKLLPVLKTAEKIENLPTHFSIHAGGIIIAPKALNNFTVTRPCSKILPLIDFDMEACKDFGLVKIDLLSQRALGVYSDAISEVKIPELVEDLEQDEKVIKFLKNGKTLGVFYIESPGMRSLLTRLRCRNFRELTAASSIIRPGVAESGMMQEYIRRHCRKTPWKAPHPISTPLSFPKTPTSQE